MIILRVTKLKLCFLLIAMSFVSLKAGAQVFGGAKFGDEQQKALAEIKAVFGEPSSALNNMYVYKDKTFKGLRWSEIHFGFRNGKLDEARFVMVAKNKRDACRESLAICNVMKQSYAMSEDLEEDGTPFYAGGHSPFGYGHLFTIFISPYKGKMTSQLRYGPFSVQ